MPTTYLGTTVTLTNCPGHDADGNDVTLNGRFDVEEYYGTEPSAYVWSPYFLLYRNGNDKDNPDSPCWDVDAGVFIEQVDPVLHAQIQEQERQMDEAMEKMALDDMFGDNCTIKDAGFRQ